MKIPKLKATPERRPTTIQVVKGDGSVVQVAGERVPYKARPKGRQTFEELIARRMGVDSLDEVTEQEPAEQPGGQVDSTNEPANENVDDVQPAG